MKKKVVQDARDFFQKAYSRHMQGLFDEAIALYEKSIEIHPTAEAYTFLGWSYSFKKAYGMAIEMCHKAIEIDPSFGNPYNDIGAYLIELGKPEEAVPWLEKAIQAKRYDCRHFAYYNLGRIMEATWNWHEAKVCYKKALHENPDYELAKNAIGFLCALAS